MKRLMSVAVCVLTVFTMVGCKTEPSTEVDNVATNMQKTSAVTGTISYRERIALHPDAEIIVTLEDASLADTYSKKISEVVIKPNGKQVPFVYELPYSVENIQANHRYLVRAKIKLGDDLLFTTDTANLVLTDPNNTTEKDLLLIRVKR